MMGSWLWGSPRSDDQRTEETVRATKARSAEAVTAFINAGANWWLDERQAWLDEVIAEETARGGRSFDW